MESYAKGEVEPPLLEETIGANFARTAATHADREALVEFATGRRWTWAELDRDVDALARGLLAAGLEKGDRIGIWAPNCAEWTLTQYAAAKAGAGPGQRQPGLPHPRVRVRRQPVRHEAARRGDPVQDQRVPRDGRGRPPAECPTLQRAVYLDTDDWAELVAERRAAARGRSGRADGDARAGRPDQHPVHVRHDRRPKGATLSHRNILNNGYFTTELINLTEQDRLCIPVPFYHCFGMVMANLGCTTHGTTMVIPAPGFDPEITLRAIAEERCTGVYGVPTMFIAMQNHPTFADHDLSSPAHRDHGRLDLPGRGDEALRRRHAHGRGVDRLRHDRDVARSPARPASDDDLERRTATIGRVHPHVEIKVVDPVTGETVERGEPGEFCTRGYSVMLGYWDDPEKTAEAIDADGWMHTGDLAEMREDGYCNIVGRIKDMVIRGGENVYPREIEEFLYAHPDIEDVQVIGVPDEKYGEELCAWIKMRAGAEPLDAEAVRAYATGKLAHYKIPRYVLVVEEFPMTVTGKIRKVEMREETAKTLGLA